MRKLDLVKAFVHRSVIEMFLFLTPNFSYPLYAISNWGNWVSEDWPRSHVVHWRAAPQDKSGLRNAQSTEFCMACLACSVPIYLRGWMQDKYLGSAWKRTKSAAETFSKSTLTDEEYLNWPWLDPEPEPKLVILILNRNFTVLFTLSEKHLEEFPPRWEPFLIDWLYVLC